MNQMKYLLLLLLVSFSAIAEDQIVQKLKEENVLLMKQMEKNHQFIEARKTLKSNFKVSTKNRTVKKIKKVNSKKEGISNIYLGLESYNWGDGIDQNAPTISYEMGDNKWSVLLSYGSLDLNNYPGDGVYTVVDIFKASIQYRINTGINSLTVKPFLGYAFYNTDSPDAGYLLDEAEAQRELDMVQRIEDATGIVPGIVLDFAMSTNWNMNFRADLGAQDRVAGLHLGYKL